MLAMCNYDHTCSLVEHAWRMSGAIILASDGNGKILNVILVMFKCSIAFECVLCL